MSEHLAPVIAASAQWLVEGYAGHGTPGIAALAQTQARQAATVAAWLRYPTAVDAALLHLIGPADATNLHALRGPLAAPAQPWRTWIDEVVVSWAACLLTDADLARLAVHTSLDAEHAAGLAWSFGALLEPDRADIRAAGMLRHPHVLWPVVRLHHNALRELVRLGRDAAEAGPTAGASL